MAGNYSFYLAHPNKTSLTVSDTPAYSNWSDVTTVDYFKLRWAGYIEGVKKTITEQKIPDDQIESTDFAENLRTFQFGNYMLGNLLETTEFPMKFRHALEYAKSKWSPIGLSTLFVYDDDFNEYGSTYTTTNCTGFGYWSSIFDRPTVLIGDYQFKGEDNNNLTLQKLILKLATGVSAL